VDKLAFYKKKLDEERQEGLRLKRQLKVAEERERTYRRDRAKLER
jgi:hypothetical protein